MLIVLHRLAAADLAEKFLREVLPKDFDGSEGDTLLKLSKQLHWQVIGQTLAHLVDQQQPKDYFARLLPIVKLCQPVCCDQPPVKGDRRIACQRIAEALAGAIERWDTTSAQNYAYNESRSGVVEGAVHIFAAAGAKERLKWFVDHVLSENKRYGLHQVLIPDVKAIFQWLPEVPEARAAAERLLDHCRTELKAATAKEIEPPADWAREANLACKCEDCRALTRFLHDPTARVGRFPIRKERRQHLHEQIDMRKLDCTHVTERKGSPQTLVCTKTQGAYERRLTQYHVDQRLLAELASLGEQP
jgi:hypothetical protein